MRSVVPVTVKSSISLRSTLLDGALSTTDREAIETYLTDKYLTVPDGPPDAPTGLGAVAGDGVVDLSWTQSVAGDVRVTPSISPMLRVSDPTDAGTYDAMFSVADTESTYQDTSVVNGTEYFYVVTATDDDPAESGPSNEVSATPAAVPLACGAPTVGLSPVLCLETDTGVSETGGAVDAWADASGQGNTVAATAGARPILTASTTPNGEAAIVFDGTDDLLERINSADAITGLPIGSADRTMFALIRYNSNPNGWGGVAYGQNVGTKTNKAFGLGVPASGRDDRQPDGPEVLG